MKLYSNLALLCSAVVLTACETVTSPVPVGEQPAQIEAGKWEGRWANAEGYLDVTVVDAKNGLVHIDYTDEGECESMSLELRSSGEWLFFNVTEEDFEKSEGLASSPCSPVHTESSVDGEDDPGKPRSFLWGRVLNKDDSIVAWAPAPEVFVRLVQEGHLPGTVNDGNVVLGPLKPNHYQIITSGSHGVVLDWEQPMVLFRSGSVADPE